MHIHADTSVQRIHWTTAKGYAVKKLRCCHLSPEPEMETGTAKQPAGCICCFSLTYIHRAWITLYLSYSTPVAALYMCSVLSTTDLHCLHFVPSKSCPCIEDCCSLARLCTVTAKYISQYFSPTWMSFLSAFSPTLLFMILWIELRKTAWFCSSLCIYVSGLPC